MPDNKIQIPIVTTYDDKEAKEALADAEKIDDLEPVVEVTAKIDQVIGALDDVVAETKRVQTAADALGQALGPELAAKADTTSIVQDLQRAGLTIEEIIADADKLGAKLREVSDTDVGGRMGANLGTARGQIDEIGKSAGSSRSALANMIGNTSQDLGAMSGIAGSAGVAIGQIGEYAADAALDGERLGSALGNMAKVAGPMAAMALAVAAINKAVKGQTELNKLAADQQERWVTALESGPDAADQWVTALGEIRDITVDITKLDDLSFGAVQKDWEWKRFFNIFDNGRKTVENLNDEFVKAGINTRDVAEAVTGGAAAYERFNAGIDAAQRAGRITRDEAVLIIGYLEQERKAYDDAKGAREEFQSVFDPTKLAAANTQQERYVELLEQQGDRYADVTAAQAAARAEQVRHTAQVDRHFDALRDVNAEYDDLGDTGPAAWDDTKQALREYNDLLAGIAREDRIADLEQAWADMQTAAEEAWTATAEGADDATAKQKIHQQSVRDLKRELALYSVEVDNIPESVVTDVVMHIDEYTKDQVEAFLNNLKRGIFIPLRPYVPPGFGSTAPRDAAGATATAAPMYVNINMPAGSRGVDVVKQVAGTARRSGRRYGVPVVHYARR